MADQEAIRRAIDMAVDYGADRVLEGATRDEAAEAAAGWLFGWAESRGWLDDEVEAAAIDARDAFADVT